MTFGEAVRGEGSPISTRERLAPDEVEYLSETDEVEIVVARNEAGPVEWATELFARYVSRRCAGVAADAVASAIGERLDASTEHVAVNSQFEKRNDGKPDYTEAEVLVTYTVWMESWGDGVKSRPSVDFDELVAVTPSDVTATVELFDREYACEVPVFVEKTRAQLL